MFQGSITTCSSAGGIYPVKVLVSTGLVHIKEFLFMHFFLSQCKKGAWSSFLWNKQIVTLVFVGANSPVYQQTRKDLLDNLVEYSQTTLKMPCGHLYCQVSGWSGILSLNKTSSAETIFRANEIIQCPKPNTRYVVLSCWLPARPFQKLLHWCISVQIKCSSV